jgi:hypothetical protein
LIRRRPRSRLHLALSCARQIRSQEQRQRGWKLYSFHAPEVECIGKGKASAPYEFGVKVSIVTTSGQSGEEVRDNGLKCESVVIL